MKPGSQVFTVPQEESAMKVLKARSIEKKVNFTTYSWNVAKIFNKNDDFLVEPSRGRYLRILPKIRFKRIVSDGYL